MQWHVYNVSAQGSPFELGIQRFYWGLIISKSSAQHVPKFQTQRKAGAQHALYCLCEQFRSHKPPLCVQEWIKYQVPGCQQRANLASRLWLSILSLLHKTWLSSDQWFTKRSLLETFCKTKRSAWGRKKSPFIYPFTSCLLGCWIKIYVELKLQSWKERWQESGWKYNMPSTASAWVQTATARLLAAKFTPNWYNHQGEKKKPATDLV